MAHQCNLHKLSAILRWVSIPLPVTGEWLPELLVFQALSYAPQKPDEENGVVV